MNFKNIIIIITLAVIGTSCQVSQFHTGKTERFDVVVYGATPSGVAAAVAASQRNLKVVLLEQTRHVGGLSTSGLNRDESEHMDSKTFGGLTDKFLSQAAKLSWGSDKYPRTWESHIAEKVLLDMLKENKVSVRYQQLISSVKKSNSTITQLTVQDGVSYKAKIFIDCTYEGDLMAKAGVSYTVGREAREKYQESLSGVRYLDKKIAVSPYDKNGKLLAGVMPGKPPAEYSESPIPLCYNIRLNLTIKADKMVGIGKPENYDPQQYELLARCIKKGYITRIGNVLGMYWMKNSGKRELNNTQFNYVSMSMPGEQAAWCEASFEERAKIHKKYRDYTHGLLWFLKTDIRVPEAMRKDMSRYGFCKDEWQDNDHWPWYLYIRAGRRMKGAFILTQADAEKNTSKEDVIHIASHYLDSHHIARYAVDKNHYINEGRIWQKGRRFDIPYRSITPKESECTNLLVPVCVSASHVAFCGIRLEATWMHLGEVSGIAAAMAIRDQLIVQNINIKKLQKHIVDSGIPLK
jgi:hypothetical protein